MMITQRFLYRNLAESSPVIPPNKKKTVKRTTFTHFLLTQPSQKRSLLHNQNPCTRVPKFSTPRNRQIVDLSDHHLVDLEKNKPSPGNSPEDSLEIQSVHPQQESLVTTNNKKYPWTEQRHSQKSPEDFWFSVGLGFPFLAILRVQTWPFWYGEFTWPF